MGTTGAVPEFQNCMEFILGLEILHVTRPFLDDCSIKGPTTRYQNTDGSYEVISENPRIQRFVWEHANDINRVMH